jgi:hypothetical protein
VISGLSGPHSPRFLDDHWLICNSARHELIRVAPGGAVTHRLTLEGWTRGIAATDRLLFVGESANRSDPSPTCSSAHISVICRQSFRVLHRIRLPRREVYDLVVVPRALLEGIRIGFRTNRLRIAESDQYALFRRAGVEPEFLWATGDKLPPQECRVTIRARGPAVVNCGQAFTVPCVLVNDSASILCSVMPHPVNLSYRWIDPLTNQAVTIGEPVRTPLRRALAPGEAMELMVVVAAHPTPGEYILRITALQELVAWFDNLDDANALDLRVRVEAPALAAAIP